MRQLPRGTVTLLFTDIEGSTRLLQDLGPTVYVRALEQHRRLLRDAFTAHGGVEVELQGDSFHYAFERAGDAVRAAVAGQRALEEVDWEHASIRVRVGLHTGEPVVSDGLYAGLDVHRAARVMSVAHGGQILVSQATRELVDEELELLDLGEHRLKDLAQPLRLYQVGGGSFPPLMTLDATNLPTPPTPLIGRRRELDELLELVRADARLVTVTGAGGSGKTRLALAAAGELVDEFDGNVYWVPLSGIRDPDLVLPTVAQTLGVKDDLRAHLAQRRVLLVLDNFEHLLPAAVPLADVLAHTSRASVLATSRAPLRIQGEREYPLDPMVEDEAVAFFLECARDAGSQLQPTATVVEVCERLDRLPLALELAAARTKLLSPDVLLVRLDQRLPLLTGGRRDAPARQRTLRATIEWSYELLDEDAQDLFARLAVFATSFSLDATEAVCAADLEALAALVDLNLLKPIGDGRLLMLDTIREFATERLRATDDEDRLRDAHAQFYAAFVDELAPDLRRMSTSVGRVRADLNNVRSALEWSLDAGRPQLSARIVTAMWSFWIGQGLIPEGLGFARRVIETIGELPDFDRAECLHAAGELARFGRDFSLAKKLKGEEIAIFERMGDHERYIARTVADLAWIALEEADFDPMQRQFGVARAFANRALELRERVGEPGGIAHAEAARAAMLFFEGRFAAARDLYGKHVPVFEAAGNIGDSMGAKLMVAECSRRLGELEDAAKLLAEILPFFVEVELFSLPECLQEIAALAAEISRPGAAATLLAASEMLRLEHGSPLWDPRDWERTLAAARTALDQGEFAKAWRRGGELQPGEALELAREITRFVTAGARVAP